MSRASDLVDEHMKSFLRHLTDFAKERDLYEREVLLLCMVATQLGLSGIPNKEHRIEALRSYIGDLSHKLTDLYEERG